MNENISRVAVARSRITCKALLEVILILEFIHFTGAAFWREAVVWSSVGLLVLVRRITVIRLNFLCVTGSYKDLVQSVISLAWRG
jgi:hypothetical protein